jgi:hypothetical protein
VCPIISKKDQQSQVLKKAVCFQWLTGHIFDVLSELIEKIAYFEPIRRG